MRAKFAVAALTLSLAMVQSTAVIAGSPTPAPQTPVAVDPNPLPLPPSPGAQNSPGAAPAASAPADPFNPLSNSAPPSTAQNAPTLAPPPLPAPPPAPSAAQNAASSFDPFANTNPAPAPAPSAAANAAPSSPQAIDPLIVPNTPLTIPPPEVPPSGDANVTAGGAGSVPSFGNLSGALPPEQAKLEAKPAMPELPPPPVEQPKPKKKVAVFKPSLDAGKKALDQGKFDTAKKNIEPFAKKGDVEAEYLMGVVYSQDKGKLRDYQQAARWYDKAAQKGMKEAQFNLGFLLYQGAGAPGDAKSVAASPGIAFPYLLAAAQQNVGMAQHLVSLLYLRGEGVQPDMFEALRWATQGAENDVAEAQFNAAMMLVRKPAASMDDYIQSYKWFTILANKGYPGAYENRFQITRYMPPNAIAYGEELARSWRGGNKSDPTMPSPMPPMSQYSPGVSDLPQMGMPKDDFRPMQVPESSMDNASRPIHPYPEVWQREKYMLRN